jgi:hypothetical protein
MNIPAGALPLSARTGPELFDVDHGLGSVIGGMINQLGAQRQALAGAAFSSVCDTIIELLPLCLRPRPELPSTLAVVDAAVRDYIRRHAADPGLTPETIAGPRLVAAPDSARPAAQRHHAGQAAARRATRSRAHSAL